MSDLQSRPPLVVTSGEPGGIGPDIILMAAQRAFSFPWVVFGDRGLLESRAQQLSIPLKFEEYMGLDAMPPHHVPNTVWIKHFSMPHSIKAGENSPHNANYVLEMLKVATKMCMSKHSAALVTAPINKKIINEADIPFTGHTEFLADLTHTPKTVMLLATQKMKVALLTTHIPLAKVPQAVTAASLKECIIILDHDLKTRFNLPNPKILVCGLNPHAGEGGYIGQEEQKIIIPTLAELKKSGLGVVGPVSADTAFLAERFNEYDVVLALYHDQGLPVIKSQGFGDAVNISLGLPFIRTSVDHGTAENIAGTGKADPSSLLQAMLLAEKLYQNERRI